jgi:type VI protein secretion system component VasK
MDPSTQTMLAANALIHKHGDAAEEYASQQLWNYQQNADEQNSTEWRSLLDAIKKVRELRRKCDT